MDLAESDGDVELVGAVQIVEEEDEGEDVGLTAKDDVCASVESLTAKTLGREKLQVRGRGKGKAWKITREVSGSEEVDDRVGAGEGQAGRGRGNGGRGRSNAGRKEGEGGWPGLSFATGGDSASDESDDEKLAATMRCVRGNDVQASAEQGDRAGSDEAAAKSSFEDSKVLHEWLSEISIIPALHFHTDLGEIPSPGFRLAFDGSAESGPTATLPLFKSAVISTSADVLQGRCQPCQDVVLHIGGSVWALDWCPRRQGWLRYGHANSEFLAVGSHPCSAPYNRLGKPLEGQGVLQIWAFEFCAIDQFNDEGGELEGRRKARECIVESVRLEGNNSETTWTGKSRGRGRGRGRTTKVDITMADSNGGRLLLEEKSRECGLRPNFNSDHVRHATSEPRKTSAISESPLGSSPTGKRRRKLKESARARGSVPAIDEPRFPSWDKEEGPAKMVLGLVHEGLVSWDAKWRPLGETNDFGSERESLRLGLLALLLGDGSIQVFDVPLPALLRSQSSQASDCAQSPTFVQMGPVFRCSNLQSGGHKSIPLCMEWSTWDPHDLILVGFHDATVGLWKFSSNLDQPEARPLMFFTADTLPLRSVAWAPEACGSSGKHIFVTAGHTGWVKFWDIRDPFRPFWDLQVSRGCIHSLDWISWPRCLLMALDDGTLRILGFDNASSITPATGESWRGTHSQGLQCYLCSSSPLWDAQICRRTGVVAYAGANGSVLQFQLTERAIVKESVRAREPHYLCGAFLADRTFGPVTLTSPRSTDPAQMRTSSTEWTRKSRTMQGLLASCTLDHQNKNASVDLDVAIAAEGPNFYGNPKKRSKAISKIDQKDASQPSLLQRLEMDVSASTEDNTIFVPAELTVTPGFECDAGRSLSQNINLGAFKTEGTAHSVSAQKLPVHRVRWNCNPGREHWLTYGGASGIIRCQQIFSMKKRKGEC